MKKKNLILCLALLLLTPISANAQIGKVKNAVKKNVGTTTTQKKKDAGKVKGSASDVKKAASAKDMLTKTYPTYPGMENTVSVSGISRFKVDKVYEPSAEAKAKDPMAADETVENGFTHTIGQIHAAYEHLNPEWFPQPYWEYPQYYYMGDKDSEQLHWNGPTYLQNEINKMLSDKEYSQTFKYDSYADGTGNTGWVVPCGYTTIQANFARFLADPLSWKAMVGFIEAHQLVADRQKGYYDGMRLATVEDSKELRKSSYSNMKTMPFTAGEWYKMQDEADLFCIGVINKKVPFKVLEDAMKVKLQHFKNAKTDWWKATYMRQIEEAWPLFDNHPGNTKTGDYELMLDDYNKFMAERDAIYEAGKWASQDAFKLNKTVTKDAATKKKVLALGKEKHPDIQIEDVVFFNANWELAKSSEWPYPITQRTQRVGLIYKKGGIYVIDLYDWVQRRQGSVYESTGHLEHPMGINGPQKVEYSKNNNKSVNNNKTVNNKNVKKK